MRNIDLSARYTLNHEWARPEGHLVTIGITDFGQVVMKSIQVVNLPQKAQIFKKGEIFSTIESNKAVNDIELPIGGKIIEMNDLLSETPSLVNTDCYGKGWLVKIQADDLGEWNKLMDAETYYEEISVFFRKAR